MLTFARRTQRRLPEITPSRRQIALAALAGAAWAVAAPPRGWWPLLPVGVAALTLAMYGRGMRARLMLGAVAGAIFYATTLWWLTDFSVPGYVAVTLLETGLLAAAAALVPAARAGPWSGGWWSLPAALVLLDVVQSSFPLGGFPLPALVLSQPDGPFAAAAPLGGSPLVTAAAATSGVALAALVLMGGRWPRRVAGAAVTFVAACTPLLIGTGVTTTTATETLDVVIVQGGGPRGVRAVFSDRAQVSERHLAMLGGIPGSPDLVLLPENVIHVDGPIAGSAVDRRLGSLAEQLNTSLVVGVTETTGQRFRNAAVLWGPDGQQQGRYEKEHRVPFGEYIPARALLEQVTDATGLVPRDAVAGQGEALLSSPIGPLGVVISYEVFFPDRVREAVTAGGQIVLVPTNAASYVTEEVPAMELAAARLRAREFGRAVLQAAPTGYSAIVLPTGEVIERSTLGTAEVLHGRVQLRTGLTPYARTEAAPLMAVTIALAVLSAAPLRRWARRREKQGKQ